MRFVPTELPGVLVVEPDVHRDGRGFFLETYHADKYRERRHRRRRSCRTTTRGRSRGTLRGLHLQLRRPQGKLVRVIEARSSTSAVDVRRGLADLRPLGRRDAVARRTSSSVYVPPGFAHGFCVVEPDRPGRIQVHRPLRSGERDRHRLERSRRWRSRGRSTEPILSDARPPASDARRRHRRASRSTGQICKIARQSRERPSPVDPSEPRRFSRKSDRARRLPLSRSGRWSDYGRAP